MSSYNSLERGGGGFKFLLIKFFCSIFVKKKKKKYFLLIILWRGGEGVSKMAIFGVTYFLHGPLVFYSKFVFPVQKVLGPQFFAALFEYALFWWKSENVWKIGQNSLLPFLKYAQFGFWSPLESPFWTLFLFQQVIQRVFGIFLNSHFWASRRRSDIRDFRNLYR